MLTVIVTVEGVLRKLTDGSRIIEGVEMVRRLKRPEVITDTALVFLTTGDVNDAAEWLSLHGLENRELIVRARDDRVKQMNRLRHEYGYPVDLVIEPNPVIAADLLREGYTVLVFAHPHYARGDWKPGHKDSVRAWEEIRSELTSSARSEDKRLVAE